MRVVICSDDDFLSKRWGNFLSGEIVVIDNQKDILLLKNEIIIFDGDMQVSPLSGFISLLVSNNNKILLLQRVPNLEDAKLFLPIGIKGYGNSMMSLSYFNSALESLKTDNIWLIPVITSQLIEALTSIKPTNGDGMLDRLTPTERSVAKLLKDGLKNQDIATKLNISLNTVKKHIKNIYEKYNVSDRLSFINIFYV